MTFRDINFHPSDRDLRIFALLWLTGFGLLGAITAWRGGAFGSGVPFGWQAPWLTPLVIWSVAAAGSALGAVWPAGLRPIYVGWMVAVFPIGWTVSQVLLIVIYFVIFTPVAVVFRLIGRDALHRVFDRQASSYWIRRPPAPDVGEYFRQS
jgi:hypothetical protein